MVLPLFQMEDGRPGLLFSDLLSFACVSGRDRKYYCFGDIQAAKEGERSFRRSLLQQMSFCSSFLPCSRERNNTLFKDWRTEGNVAR